MIISKRHSVNKLQKEINKQLMNLQRRRPTSLTSLPSSESLRSSFSKSVKSVFIDEDNKDRQNKSFKDKDLSPKSYMKQTKLGRSQDVIGLKKMKNTFGKLKKKKSQKLTRQFTTMSRKQSQPTQVGSALSSISSSKQNEIQKLRQRNKTCEQKIKSQKMLIERLEQIIEEMGN